MRHVAHFPHLPPLVSPLGNAQRHVKEVGRRNARVMGITIIGMGLVILLAIALWFASAH
jgi:hypothetical protein